MLAAALPRAIPRLVPEAIPGAVAPVAPQGGVVTSPCALEGGPLAAIDPAVHRAGPSTVLVIGLALAVLLFLAVHGTLDRSDPKLAAAADTQDRVDSDEAGRTRPRREHGVGPRRRLAGGAPGRGVRHPRRAGDHR